MSEIPGIGEGVQPVLPTEKVQLGSRTPQKDQGGNRRKKFFSAESPESEIPGLGGKLDVRV